MTGRVSAVSSAKTAEGARSGRPRSEGHGWGKDFKLNWILYLIFIPCAVYFIIFNYIPMMGVLMAFQDVIGWENFTRLFTTSVGSNFWLAIRNTVVMSLLNITFGFAAPVILAILVSEVKNKGFRRFVQTVTYMPYFVSAVVVCQIVKELVGDEGVVTAICGWFGYSEGNLLAQAEPPTFWLIYMFTDIWQNAGYSSIIFVAAIHAIDPSLYEAAAEDHHPEHPAHHRHDVHHQDGHNDHGGLR